MDEQYTRYQLEWAAEQAIATLEAVILALDALDGDFDLEVTGDDEHSNGDAIGLEIDAIDNGASVCAPY